MDPNDQNATGPADDSAGDVTSADQQAPAADDSSKAPAPEPSDSGEGIQEGEQPSPPLAEEPPAVPTDAGENPTA